MASPLRSTVPAGRRARLAWWSRRALLAACLLAGLVLATRALSRRFVFPTHRVAAARAPAGFAPRVFRARDGAPVRALELAGPAGAPVLVHFHDNRSRAAAWGELARAMGAYGVGVLLVEYRGYDPDAHDVDGPSEQGLYLDAEAALDGLAARGVHRDRVVLWGTSLGTGVAAEMARRGRGAALVLVAPYTSIPDLVTDVVPLLPGRALLPDHFDTLAKAGEIRVPTLVVHGDADEVVPFWMGERLARAIRGARLLRVPAGRHGDLFARQRERILGAMLAVAHHRAM